MLPLLVGESPSRTGDRYWMFPLSGAVAQTLCTVAGIAPQPKGSRYGRWTWALYERFHCANAVERYPRGGWPRETAATRLGDVIAPDQLVVVLLGRRVQIAYVDSLAPAETDVRDRDFFEWAKDGTAFGTREVVVLPHPSSLNRVLNDAVVRRRMGEGLREAMAKARTTTALL